MSEKTAIKTMSVLRTSGHRTHGIQIELGHGVYTRQSLAWLIRIAWPIKGPSADQVSQQFARLSCTSRRTRRCRADLSFGLRGRGCGTGCRANENTTDKAASGGALGEPRAYEQQMELVVYIGPPLYSGSLLRTCSATA